MGGSISQLHRLRNRFLVKAEGTVSSFEKHFGEGTISCTQFQVLFGEDNITSTKPIFYSLTSEFDFPNRLIPVDLVITFLKLGRIPFDRLPPKSRANARNERPNERLEETEETALVPKINTTIQKPCSSNMWKKYEITINDKIIITTTVENGIRRVLTETDRSQNEVIHIENEMGMFAHREYSQQEQIEKLDDDEFVTFLRATEEFIHLKNEYDEYEYIHTDIPENEANNSGDDDADSKSD